MTNCIGMVGKKGCDIGGASNDRERAEEGIS